MKAVLSVFVLLLIVHIWCDPIEERAFSTDEYDKSYLSSELQKALGTDVTESQCTDICPMVFSKLGVDSNQCNEVCSKLMNLVNG